MSDPFLDQSTPSPLVRRPRTTMYGRTTHMSMERGLNLEHCRSSEITIRIGTSYEPKLSGDAWTISQRISMCDVTTSCAESSRIILRLLLSNENAVCTGVQLASGSLEGPGTKQVTTHTLRIRDRSFGAVTEIMSMLSSTNFVEALTSDTCSDGSIDIRLSLNLKAARLFYKLE